MEFIDLADPEVRVRVARSPRARRFTLRLETGGGAVLTTPPHVPGPECEAFVRSHTGWLRKALAHQPPPVTVTHGVTLPVAGVPTPVAVLPGKRRAPSLQAGTLVLQGAGAEGKRIAQWLKLRARDALQPAVHRYAGELGRSVTRVALRDTKSRWGSCSTTGTVSFSWRLAMAPPEVLEYVAAHEAAHLAEMNHSPAYWALVDRLMPDWKRRRDWLKREGRGLHRYRFEAAEGGQR